MRSGLVLASVSVATASGLIRKRIARLLLTGSMLTIGAPATAGVMSINLNDFFFFAGDPVTVAAGGSSATIGESASFSPISLSNVPGAGDPEVIVAAPGRTLQLDFSFSEPAGNDDTFRVNLLDGNSGDVLPGFSAEFLSSESGDLSFDLDSFVGTTLGLEFALGANPGDGALDSQVTVSNVRLVDPAVAVSAPNSIILLLLGALAFRIRVNLRDRDARDARAA